MNMKTVAMDTEIDEKGKTIADLVKENGIVEDDDGNNYVYGWHPDFHSDFLDNMRMIDGPTDDYYACMGYRLGDTYDDDEEYPPEYILRWEILPEYVPERDSESEACDWTMISSATRHYNP